MGLARLKDAIASSNSKNNKIGCLEYMPPEFYTGKFTNKLDVFTFGLTLNELFNGSHQYNNKGDENENKSNKNLSNRISIVKSAEKFFFVVEKCIQDDAESRPASVELEQLFFHFTNIIDSNVCSNYSKLGINEKNEVFEEIYNSKINDIN